MKLNVAYFGTPDFSADFLEKLLTDKDLPIEVVLVVTQPDKPAGRKQILTPSPVKRVAERYCIPYTTGVGSEGLPTARNAESTGGKSDRQAPSLKNIDLALLFAYGAIIPKKVLDLPRLGFWNIHPSLLPKYRGASPIVFPILNGDKKTGVTLMQMDEELDHGPIIAQKELEILPTDTQTALEKKLTNLGFEIFKNVIVGVENPGLLQARSEQAERALVGKDLRQAPQTIPQDHSLATYTRRLTKQDGFIEQSTVFRLPTTDLFRLFRAYHPWPGIWTKINVNEKEMRLKLTDVNETGIQKVQLEGKNEVDFSTFQKAYPGNFS